MLSAMEDSPVSKEQALLETYFQCLAHFAYDKAKELCEREREMHKAHPGATWVQMVSCLAQLSIAEKTYSSLQFLEQKWFGRRDSLRGTYSVLLTEMKKIEEIVQKTDYSGAASTDSMLENLIGHLCGQLTQFLTARSKTIEFYEQMVAMGTLGTNRNISCEDLLTVIQDIIQSYQKMFHHPILAPLKHGFSLECEILQHLLCAQIEMSKCAFLPSLLHLNDANSKLTDWTALQPVKESKRLSFGMSKNPPVPHLKSWLMRYKGQLVSKFSLYFYDVLSKQAPAPEFKSNLAKTSIDFYGKIVSFQKKTDAQSVALVFDTNGLEGTQRRPGYHHPSKYVDTPRGGLENYPAIFSYPNEHVAERHWPNIISIITDPTSGLNTVDKHVYVCDENLQCTYFLSKIEARITLIVIFEAKKAEKDSAVNNFLVDLTTLLRGTKLFASLKPGIKG